MSIDYSQRRSTSRPHVVLEMQGAQMYNRSTMPAPRIRAIAAKVVHVAEVEVARPGNSLFVAGNSTTSSAVRPHLFALAIRERRRREAFSQDFLDVRLDLRASKLKLPRCPIISRRVSFSARSSREFRASSGSGRVFCLADDLYHDPRRISRSRGIPAEADAADRETRAANPRSRESGIAKLAR